MRGTAEIKTQRLRLRRYVPEDASVLHARFGVDERMYEYSGWNPYATEESARETVCEYIANDGGQERAYAWIIELDGAVAGLIGAYSYEPDADRIEVGLSVDADQWGRGIATEALSAVLRYLTESEDISAVTAWCAAENTGSKRAMEKAGMRQIRIEPAGLTVGERTFDRLVYEYHRQL